MCVAFKKLISFVITGVISGKDFSFNLLILWRNAFKYVKFIVFFEITLKLERDKFSYTFLQLCKILICKMREIFEKFTNVKFTTLRSAPVFTFIKFDFLFFLKSLNLLITCELKCANIFSRDRLWSRRRWGLHLSVRLDNFWLRLLLGVQRLW